MTLPKYLYCIPFFLSLTAFILLFVGTSCHYVEFPSNTDMMFTDPVSGEETQPASLRFGLWYYQSWNATLINPAIYEGSCDLYPQTINVDNNWKAARGFSLIALILAGSLLLLDVFQGCLSTKRNKSYRMGAIGYFICCISAGFTLLLLDSNVCKNNALVEELNRSFDRLQFQQTCSMGQGAKSTIASVVMFFVASVGIALLHPAPKEKDQNNRVGNDDGLDEPLFNDDINII